MYSDVSLFLPLKYITWRGHVAQIKLHFSLESASWVPPDIVLYVSDNYMEQFSEMVAKVGGVYIFKGDGFCHFFSHRGMTSMHIPWQLVPWLPQSTWHWEAWNQTEGT